MLNSKFFFLAANLMLVESVALAANITPKALPVFPVAAEARATQLNAKISPAARIWIQQEAKRETASNNISEASARQAITAAGSVSAVDLTKMSVDDAIIMIMAKISDDARNDMKQLLTDTADANAKKKEVREQAAGKQLNNKIVANNNLHVNAAQLQSAASGANTSVPAADINAMQNSKDSLSEVGEEQQLKMQAIMDRMKKADEAASSAMKKFSDVSSAISGNIK